MEKYPDISHDYFPFVDLEALGTGDEREREPELLSDGQRASLLFCLNEGRNSVTLDPDLAASAKRPDLLANKFIRLLRRAEGGKKESVKRTGLLVGIDSGKYDPLACSLYFRRDRRKTGREGPAAEAIEAVEAIEKRLRAMPVGQVQPVSGVHPDILTKMTGVEVLETVWDATYSGKPSPYLARYDENSFSGIVSPNGAPVFDVRDIVRARLSPYLFEKVPGGLKYNLVATYNLDPDNLKTYRFRQDGNSTHFSDCPKSMGRFVPFYQIGALVRENGIGCIGEAHDDCLCAARLRELKKVAR